MRKKIEKRGSKGHLAKVCEVNGAQPTFTDNLILLPYSGRAKRHNLKSTLRDVKRSTHDGGW